MAIIYETTLSDLLNGTNKDDTIYGGAGSDTIHGLQGDDKIVGEQEALIYSNIAGVITIPTSVTFGGDYLYGDQGSDSLYGDIADSSQLLGFLDASLRPNAPLNNQLIFGNDTFQFSLGGSNGNDVVKDMNGGAVSTATCTVTNVIDTLKFTDVMDVGAPGLDYHDVDAASTFSNSCAHLKMSFNGGSILFENINYAGQTSIADLYATPADAAAHIIVM